MQKPKDAQHEAFLWVPRVCAQAWGDMKAIRLQSWTCSWKAPDEEGRRRIRPRPCLAELGSASERRQSVSEDVEVKYEVFR